MAMYSRLAVLLTVCSGAAFAGLPRCELWQIDEWRARAVVPVDFDAVAGDELYRVTDWQVALLFQDGRSAWDMPNPGLSLPRLRV